MSTRAFVLLNLLPCLLAASGCRGTPVDRSIVPTYDPTTGRLTRLDYDSDKNGKVDTVSHMDGTRVLKIEIDKDEDGRVERWEHYGADQKLEKVGASRLNDGVEDSWSFARPDGSIERVEISARRDGVVTRTEHYERNLPVRAEEDSDGDGVVDKWETFSEGRLTSVAFDSARRGRPDRRLVYAADGSAHVEVDATGTGQWVLQKAR